MSKKLRDWLSIIFIILFIVLTTFTFLYATGHRFAWRWPPRFDQILQKTGMLIIETTPSEAIIFLDDQEKNTFFWRELKSAPLTSPAKIKNLLPGEYKIRLEKEEYWPLERTIKIYPGQTTYLTNIFMFRRSLPLNIFSGDPQSLNLSPNRRIILLPNSATAISLRNNDLISLPITNNLETIQWSKDGKKIMTQGKVYNLETGQLITDLMTNLGTQANNLYWDENTNKVFYQYDNGLAYLTINQQSSVNLLTGGNYLDFLVKSNYLHVLEKTDNTLYLNTYSLGAALRQRSISLPTGQYSFYYRDNTWLNLYDNQNKRLILVEPGLLMTEQKIINQVTDWIWPNNNFLLWHNGREIYSWSPGQPEKLLIRISEEITGLAWHPAKNYLIYSTNNYLRIVYFQDNQLENIDLLRAENISSLILDEKNNLLYFAATIGQQGGIFKLIIQ